MRTDRGLRRIFADAAGDPNACVKVMHVPDGKRLSNARLKPKGDVFGEWQFPVPSPHDSQLVTPGAADSSSCRPVRLLL